MAHSNKKKKWLGGIWHSIARFFCTTIVCSLYLVRAYGMKNVPKKGALLLICNHQSFLDPIFSQSWVWRNFHFIARDSLFEIRFFGGLIGSLHTIPIKRGKGDIGAMKAVIERLREGLPVCMYSESARTFDGKIDDIKPGFGLLSRRGKAQVLPAVIEGAFEIWPRTRKFPKLGKVVVAYGEPFSPEQIKELGDKEFAKILTEKLREMQNELRVKLGKEPFDYSVQEKSEAGE